MLGAAHAQQLGDAKFLPSAEHPVGFRGDGTGRFPGATNAPTSWMSHGVENEGPYQRENIKWMTELNGHTESTPIVVGAKVVTLEEPNFVVCLDADTGKVLWRVGCDHLTIFDPDKQARGRELMREIDNTYYGFQSLAWEYRWLKSDPSQKTDKNSAADHPGKDPAREREIEEIWKERAFGGTPGAPLSCGHGGIPFNLGTPEYDKLADVFTELQVDFGIAPMLHISHTQMSQHGMTQNTPTSDGSSIFATFASGQTVCLDLNGNVRWMKWHPHDLDRAAVRASFSSAWGAMLRKGFTGMSPLLVDDKLIVTQGYAIRALSKATGDILWEVKYGNGVEAPGERRAYKGPSLLALDDGTKALIFPQGYVIRPSDGKVLSSLSPWDMFGVPSGNVHCAIMGLTTHGDTCYFSWAYGGGALRVVKTGQDGVAFQQLWRNTIEASALSPKDITSAPARGLSAETLVETSPLFDPERERLYLSVHLRGLWAMDATDGTILAHMGVPNAYNGGPPFAHASNELVNPLLVGGKHVFSCRESGGTSLYDANDIKNLVSENQILPDIRRDLMQRKKPWSEIKGRTIDRYFYTAMMWVGGNDDHRTPSDLFVHGDKVFIRSIDGIYCVQAAR